MLVYFFGLQNNPELQKKYMHGVKRIKKTHSKDVVLPARIGKCCIKYLMIEYIDLLGETESRRKSMEGAKTERACGIGRRE